MQNELKIAAIQTHLTWENPQENLKRFEKKIEQLEKDTDLLILPEMFSTGFTMQPSSVAETMQGPTIQWMLESAHTNEMAMVGSVVILENHRYFNRAVFVKPNGEISWYDKRHLFGLAGEEAFYTRGNQRLLVAFKGWTICPLICYDLRFPVWSRNTVHYDLLLYMANWPRPRMDAWDALLRARAIENMSYCIGVNRIGKDANGFVYSGHTTAYDFFGVAIGTLPEKREGILQCVLSKSTQQKTRKKLNFLKDKDTFTVDECVLL